MQRRVARPEPSKAATADDRRDLVEGYLTFHPELREKILRALLLALHARGFVTLDEIYDRARAEARARGGEPIAAEGAHGDDPNPNVSAARRWDAEEKRVIDALVVDYTARYFTAGEIDALVILTRKRNEAEYLSHIANAPDVSFATLGRKLAEYCELPGKWVSLPASEATGVRVSLIRRIISEQLDFLGVAKKHLTLRDLNPLMARTIGSESGHGRLGGKAAGMLLASCILRDAKLGGDDQLGAFSTPESMFLRTDLFMDFLRLNGLMEYNDQKYKEIDEVRSEFPAVREVFKNAGFPESASRELRRMLERIGRHPLIVRSSSLLEDNFNYAFSGKYASLFLGNQGSLDDRHRELLGAIAEVYASTIGPDPIAYRRARKLLDYEEMMGVIIQKVVGRTYGRYFLPAWAGVAFSHNEYRWNPRIRKQDGLMRIVLGLGSRAVDRVGDDYPRMVALGQPTLRPEASVEDTRRYSQKLVDVIDLEQNRFRSIPLAELLEAAPLPFLDRAVSIYRDGELITPATRHIDAEPEELVVTFEKLLLSPELVPKVRWMLETIERAYGQPIDVEFAYDGELFHILQCRPLSCRVEMTQVDVPTDVPQEDRIFGTDRDVGTADIADIEYVVYVDPIVYEEIETAAERHTIGSIVGMLNRKLAGKRFALMGPGRWGSSNIRLGVQVTYADISNTKLLVEVARARGDYEPEVSFGTHFFQDLVESGIHHLPLYPDRPGAVFNEAFLLESRNELGELLPELESYADVVRVIHVPAVAGGRTLRVMMDGDSERALGFLDSAPR